jgi:hypothetical protein
MIFSLLLVLAAPPAPPSVGDISAPLGHIGNVVEAPPKGGTSDSDRVVIPAWEGCEPKGVFLMRFMGGTARALEQLQQSLDRTPGAEKKLFARKDTLGEVMRQLGSSKLEPKRACTPSKLSDGFRLELGAPPKKWCDAKGDAQDGEFWFFANGKPAGVISVQKGGADVCKPRLSTVLFDAKGAARVRLHADWGGELSATLVGDRCQVVDYSLDSAKQAFVGTWKSCKR